jgi:aarF domain-containing kinase
VTDLKGFYVKTAQIISSRQDLFPEQYTDALSGFTDNLDPMPASLAKAVIQSELLHADETFDDVFLEFDDEPLGAASVAQVHRAVLTEKYGGREVAIKVQRPSIESKLLGDIANLKAITKTFRDSPSLPLDYYTVFCELEKQLAEEFDFVAEAVAMDRIYNSLKQSPDGRPRELPLVIPRPVAGLISRRVLVMDFLRGVPLSRAKEQMASQGVDPDSPEAKLFSRKLLSGLTTCFGQTILETGFFHADPHPGNIFVLEDGQVGLIDFGQVKQISGRNRETLCKIMIALDEREGDERREDLDLIGKLAIELGVEFRADAGREASAAVGMWLFDGTVARLPGGYDLGELSPNSPVKEIKSFPQDLVLVGRSSILIKGLSSRLDIPWSLAKEWAPIARNVLANNYRPASTTESDRRVRFHDVWKIFRQWSRGRATGVVRRLPTPIRSKVIGWVAAAQERKARQTMTQRR